MELLGDHLRTFKVVLESGTLESAARELSVTPSAVSQRLKSLERQVGSVLFIRSRPIRATASGNVLLRLARETELLAAEARAELGLPNETSQRVEPSKICISVNADSLASWFTPVLHGLAQTDHIVCEILRHDEAHSTELLRSGQVMGAVTTKSMPVQGCTSVPLGVMTYRAMATSEFIEKWLPGEDPHHEFAQAPMVSFDRNDDLQLGLRRRILGKNSNLSVSEHFVPDSVQYVEAVRASLGWGMILDFQDPQDGSLMALNPMWQSHISLYWQRWKIPSTVLDTLSNLVCDAAQRAGMLTNEYSPL
ncbi:ArgP/LysG family DNA-binding transcriptional regulator [Arthrobacter sp. MYb227]|uniref:ArgP/LysG family DNA-binding transcriptional regulator n=1 Tax=Arthrobacter sp. MYb227 TaxID=1848601 RepID=UPI000CFD6905|nr:ArgP/LysG family DNA-binding transcriptional regulator [Arthrobacter sp. MYb227]PQZ90256.1 ArgP/LysG family DNA-binding transcriptional regulator [Arthrobacter sp. MYb227]